MDFYTIGLIAVIILVIVLGIMLFFKLLKWFFILLVVVLAVGGLLYLFQPDTFNDVTGDLNFPDLDTCEAYCKEQPHIQCTGHWEITGNNLDDCNCAFICDAEEN
jgi:hypothetical protein